MTWGQWLALGVAKEAVAISRHQGTLSELIARTWRTETPVGRAVYLASLAATSVYMAVHITRFQYSTKAQALR